MHPRPARAAPTLALALSVPALVLAGAAPATGTVDQVMDGDTVYVSYPDGQREIVRVLGIDAPENFRRSAHNRRWARAARARLTDLVEGLEVRLEGDPGRDRDRYGRRLSYLHLEDGTDAGAQMLAAGYAVHLDAYPHPRAEAYARLEAQARAGRQGVFSPAEQGRRPGGAPAARPSRAPRPAASPPAPAATRPKPTAEEDLPAFMVSVTGKVHRGSCDAEFVVRDRKAGRMQSFSTLVQAQAEGSSFCKVCRPYSGSR